MLSGIEVLVVSEAEPRQMGQYKKEMYRQFDKYKVLRYTLLIL